MNPNLTNQIGALKCTSIGTVVTGNAGVRCRAYFNLELPLSGTHHAKSRMEIIQFFVPNSKTERAQEQG